MTSPESPKPELIKSNNSQPISNAPRSDDPLSLPLVFISHSSRDAAIAGLITDTLGRAGIPCWLAPRDIPAGGNWNSAIMAGINTCRALVLLYSRHSVASDPVMREVERAVARRVPVLPVRLEKVAPSAALEYLISTFQWVDAHPAPVERHLETVTAAVKQLLNVAHELPKKNPGAPPKYVGPYRILEPLGEGGMGSVYKAQQQAPLKRTVAIKLIKLGLATNEVLARFETERQALARMDNPHIAKVLDAGADEAGRPYFVMEYVPGSPITQFADDNKLSVEQRLELFTQVCDAVAHAHTKALIHRDVKTSNVLAHMVDGHPIAKVIDFGIAKALTGDKLTDRTFNTERGSAIGSYEAMSPEQADGSPDIDTRTDVYSLGVLLYELLTGAKPIDPQSLVKASDAEVRRTIREVEPPRPSARFGSLGDARTTVARNRRVHPTVLAARLRSELEWIPMMAMRKDRHRRYASPLELAEDVRNYLENRPLKAGPESLGYWIKKALRRNRVGIAVLTGFIVLSALGIVTYIQGIRTEQEKTSAALQSVTEQKGLTDAALQSVTEQKGLTEAALADVNDQKKKTQGALVDVRNQKQKADDALKLVKEQKQKVDDALEATEKARRAEWDQAEVTTAINGFLLRMLASADSDDESGGKITVSQAIAASAKLLDKGELKEQPHVEARLRFTIGQMLRKLGSYDEAESNLQRAIALYRKLPGGAALIRRGFKPAGALVEDNEILFGKSELAAALEEMALLRAAQEKYTEAVELAREALKHVKAGMSGTQNKARCARTIGSIFQMQEKWPEAEAAYREAIELASKLYPNLIVDIAALKVDVGYVLQLQKKYTQAEEAYRQALDLARTGAEAEKKGFFDEVVNGDAQVSRSLLRLARVLWIQEKLAEAEKIYRELVDFQRKNLPEWRVDLAINLWNLGVILKNQGKHADAKSFQYEALEINRKIRRPGHPALLLCLNNLGFDAFKEGKHEEAFSLLQEWLGHLRKALKRDDPELLSGIVTVAALSLKAGKFKDAEPLLREALVLGKEVLKPNDPQLADWRHWLVRALVAQKKHAQAEPLLREILRDQLALRDTDPIEIQNTFHALADALESAGMLDQAEKTMREAVAHGHKAWPQGDAKLATALDNLGSLLERRDKLPEAEKFHTEALAMYRKKLPADHPDIAFALNNLAHLRLLQEKLDDAAGLMAEATKIVRKAMAVDAPQRLQIVVGFALILEKHKKQEEGEKVLREELSLAKEKLGIKDATTVSLASFLADMLDRTGQKGKATAIRKDYGIDSIKKEPTQP